MKNERRSRNIAAKRAAALALSAVLLAAGAAGAVTLNDGRLYVQNDKGGASLQSDAAIDCNDVTEIKGNLASSDVSGVQGGAVYSGQTVTFTQG